MGLTDRGGCLGCVNGEHRLNKKRRSYCRQMAGVQRRPMRSRMAFRINGIYVAIFRPNAESGQRPCIPRRRGQIGAGQFPFHSQPRQAARPQICQSPLHRASRARIPRNGGVRRRRKIRASRIPARGHELHRKDRPPHCSRARSFPSANSIRSTSIISVSICLSISRFRKGRRYIHGLALRV